MNAHLAEILPPVYEAAARGPVLTGFDLATTIVIYGGIALTFIGIILCFLRLLKGPHLADRALAADTIAIQLVALVALFTIHFNTLAFFDGALIISLVGFATTVAMGQYIVRLQLCHRGSHERPATATLTEKTR